MKKGFDHKGFEKFKRSVTPVTSRAPKGEKTPDSIMEMVQKQGPASIKTWWKAFCHAEKNWGLLKAKVKKIMDQSEASLQDRDWLTESQMMDHWKNDIPTVKGLIETCMKDTERHRRMEGAETVDSAMEYHVKTCHKC